MFMNKKSVIKQFLQHILIGSIGISMILFAMSKLSEFALIHKWYYIYYPVAIMILAFFMYYSEKILARNPLLLFILLIYSFYLLIGHGFIYSTWKNRNSGQKIVATSMTDLNKQLIENKNQHNPIGIIKPIPQFKIYRQYSGFYHYTRYIHENYTEFYFHAVPYASEDQYQNLNFPLWIVCEGKRNIRTHHFCYDDIDTSKGAAFLIDDSLKLKAIKDSIESNKLTTIEKPIMLQWASNPQVESTKALNLTQNSLKIIIVSWLVMSSFSFVINLFKARPDKI